MNLKAQLGLQLRTPGVGMRNLRQQQRAIRPSRIAVATAEAAEETAPQEERKQRRGPPRGGRAPRATIGPERTMQIADIEVGKEYNGTIVSITDFGAFVNIGANADGLIHISQLSTEFVRNVADAASVGQELSVRILSVDTEKGKFAATAIPAGQEPKPREEGDRTPRTPRADRNERPRQARQAPNKERRQRQPVPVNAGDVITGKIASVAPFGVFVEVGNGYTGMLHSSQMKLPEGVEDHLGAMKEGDDVECRVMSVSRDKIALTQKSEDEVQADKDAREKGLAATAVVPEGATGMAYLFARAGINADQFKGNQQPKKEEKAAKKEAPAAAAAAPAEEKKAEKKAEKAPAAAAAAGSISAAVVKELREATGAGMMDCKKALGECGGDLEAAKEFLRKKGLASADKKSSRVAAEGAVWSYIHAGSRLGVLVEVNCETDFVARGEKFKELVNDMAMQIAACPDILVVSPADVPAEVLEKEKAIEMQKEDLLSKPEATREKIVEGRVAKIANEKALTEQAFIKDTSKTVGEYIKEQIATLGENIQVRRFHKFNLGEGIELADKGDFAAEVEEQQKAMVAKAAEKKAEEPKEEKKDDKAAAPAVSISAAVVKQLREETGAGMMDCKKALAECGGDVDSAREFLRKKGLASADKKSSRVAAEGAIGAYIHAGSRLGVLVEVNCETDFVARGEKFKELVNDMAMQIAACPDVIVTNATDVPAEVLEKEKAIELQKEDLQNKPEAMREKIVEGRVAKIAKEMALMEQTFIKDTSKTVAEYIKEQIATIGENIQVRRFVRFNLGEGIEVQKGDFAAEVAAQTGGKI